MAGMLVFSSSNWINPLASSSSIGWTLKVILQIEYNDRPNAELIMKSKKNADLIIKSIDFQTWILCVCFFKELESQGRSDFQTLGI